MRITTFGRPWCLAFSALLVGWIPALAWTSEGGPERPDEELSGPGVTFFETKIRPVLASNCYACHSAQAGQSEGSLVLDTRAGIRTGGDRGPAVVPFKPEESLLLKAVAHTDPDLQMPPKGDRLSAAVVRDIQEWIKMGAPDPRVGSGQPAARRSVDLEAGRQFWSLRPPVRPEIPSTSDPGWARRDLDHFILAGLDAAGLKPSPDASPATLLRRVHFDLVGLPPSPAALREFEQRVAEHGIDRALAAEVDRLLATSQYGEHWGRHWLDVARFAESSGKEANISFPHAWRYRDYVIDCFNADLPYDRFLVEQLAGDLLPYDSPAERARLLIATGFLAVGPKNLEEGNILQFLADVVDEQIDAVTRAILASSVACARCHDHKFDPYAMEDYYALAGIFASTKTYFGTAVSPANRTAGDPLPLPRIEGQLVFHRGIPQEQVEKLKAELAALQREQAEGMAAVQRAVKAGEDPGEIFTLRDALRIFWRTGAIEGQLESVDETGNPLPLAMGVLDRETIFDVPLLERGEIGRPGQVVPRGFPRVLQWSGLPSLPSSQSGRLELAQWLTDPRNPLTARVMANRVWHYLLGTGLVRTVDNFGTTGEAPSHPELLDHLAIRFVEQNWSIKQLVREIVLCRTYRQASTYREAAFLKDPDNRLVWRASKRRLNAEAIRDAMLQVSGEIDLQRPPGSLVARLIGDRPISLIGLDQRIPADLDGTVHRSVYLPVLRDRLPDVLDLFDFASPSLVTGAREVTNVPLQALYLMNSPFVQARAEALAESLEAVSREDEPRVVEAFQRCFARAPTAGELDIALEFLAKGPQRSEEQSDARRRVWASYCQALLSTAEFRNLD